MKPSFFTLSRPSVLTTAQGQKPLSLVAGEVAPADTAGLGSPATGDFLAEAKPTPLPADPDLALRIRQAERLFVIRYIGMQLGKVLLFNILGSEAHGATVGIFVDEFTLEGLSELIIDTRKAFARS